MRLVAGAAVAALVCTGCGRRDGAGPVAGTWHVHTFYLTVSHSGAGTFRWPTHVPCGEGPGHGPPPCDQVAPSGVISDGGHARLRILDHRGGQASGEVTGSSQTSVVPDGRVTLSLGSNDVLDLRFSNPPSVKAYSYLCGPGTDRQLTNCGA